MTPRLTLKFAPMCLAHTHPANQERSCAMLINLPDDSFRRLISWRWVGDSFREPQKPERLRGEKKAQTRLGARQQVVSAFLTFSGKCKESRTQGSPRLSCLWALVYWSWKTGVCRRCFGVWWKKSEQTLNPFWTAEVWTSNKCQVWLGTPDWTFPKTQLELPVGARGDLWPLAN